MKRLLKPEPNPSAGTKYRVPRSLLLKIKPLAILALCFVPFCKPCRAQQNNKTVLFLHSENADAPVFVAEEQRIRSTLTSAFGDGVQFFVEYMDRTRLERSGYLDSLAAYLHEKYALRRIDLEVAIGPEALPFIVQYRNAVSPLTPVVFSYPDVGFLNRTSLPANITGLIPQLEVKPTLDLILVLHPETKMVAIVLGPTSTRPNLANYLESVKTQIQPFHNRLDFTFIGEGGIGDVTSQVAALPPGTPTLYLFYVGDRGKNFISAVNAANVVTNIAKGPVYDTSDAHMGHGIVGGSLSSDIDYQTDMAQLALRVLQGAMPPPRIETQQSRYIFDERQLKRWKIDPHKLPPGSEIRFHEPTVWEQYQWWIIAGVGVIVFEALLISGLLVQRKKRRWAEDALRESKDKLRLLLDSTAEAIYGIDLEHRCTFCNPTCLRDLGYEHVDEVMGKNMHNLIHHTRADGTSFPVEECGVHRVTRTGEGVHAENEMFWTANGTSFPVEYWSYPQRRGEEVVGAVVAFVDITERKLAEAALANVSRRLIEAHEQERTRIGRDLNDDVVQRLALLSIELEGVQQDIPDAASELRTRIGALRSETTELTNDVQLLSHELHSSKLEYFGIVGAAKNFCKESSERQKVEIDFQSQDLPTGLPTDLSLSLFRVLQEALRNATKHSGVKHFEVRLWGSTGEAHLTVSDLGAGFDIEGAMKSTGLGLTSMQERLRLVHGELSIKSQPKGGTTIHARVPCDSSSDSAREAG